jgi:F0F1-type ATP synthase assembly protein I
MLSISVLYFALITLYVPKVAWSVLLALGFSLLVQLSLVFFVLVHKSDLAPQDWLRVFYRGQAVKFGLTLVFFWVIFSTMQQGSWWIIVTVLWSYLAGWLLPEEV